jgi:DNA-binding MarR family transcriptional regulator
VVLFKQKEQVSLGGEHRFMDSEVVKPSITHTPRENAAKKLLHLFYPVHYVVGMKVEDTLRTNDLLNRHQVAVLWIIRSEGTNGISMRRKNIENALTGWYETSSSAISKAVRALAKPPLSLVTIQEHPQSAREKLVTLTPAGEKFLLQMTNNGVLLCSWYLSSMEKFPEEMDTCLYIFSKVNAIFEFLIDQERGETVKQINTNEMMLRHPLTSTFLTRSYSLDEIPRIPREYASLMQLNAFFPIHYTAGNRLEIALRRGANLSRQQVIILWIISAEGHKGMSMPRKAIEKALRDWLEITSSSVSKAIRSLTGAPHNILTIVERPESGREKLVCLTEEGKVFAGDMFQNGIQFLDKVIENLSNEEIDMVLHVFERTSEIFGGYPGPFRDEKEV